MSKLSIVGIGPGNYENMTIRADRELKESDVIIGYGVYVDLVKERYSDKEFITTPMTRESERCRIALETAQRGKKTSLICSGDSGVYGMAALVYELRGERKEPCIEVIPGITAAISGGALAGAPLTHDFAVISLSDRLTEWKKIEKRLRGAAEADFSIVIYNPQSKTRAGYLKRACDILLEYLPESRICAIVQNIGRSGENKRIMTLKQLSRADADMFCTIFVGNEMTMCLGESMVTPRGYNQKADVPRL